ncbi:ABC transporter ATP-binding protein [Actinocatenispora comari]|uniref:Multidrug ABC transporter ATP-binding protein n=1 Tax=Actinocatenispora comari TaxID=2807577 RepID=A0A8J4A8E8_9ACTN|nr:ABC transporter ATP-binding protein [Actinocatenispora comari]GIL26819.1 multidrug ABC transporter ATP-binding protein [Actinocatenispora comari]
MTVQLPVATPAQVRRYARTLARRHPKALATALVLHALAAIAGLGAPRLLGNLVQAVQDGTTRVTVDKVALAIAAFVIGQSVLTRFARLVSFRLGERVLAELREEFVRRVLALPLSTVERAGTGDLLTRTSRDVDALARTVRFAVPETLIALVTTVLTLGALALVGPLVALPCLIAVPILWASTRWYLRRATAGYLRENAAYSDVNEGLAETVEGARTVEAMRLARQRIRRTDGDIGRSFAAERYTLWLRSVWFPAAEVSYVIPVVATLLVGGLLYTHGMASLGQVTAATLYVQQLIDPVDRLLSWLDELQVGGASLARLLGVSAGSAEPRSADDPDGVRSAADSAGSAGSAEARSADDSDGARSAADYPRAGAGVAPALVATGVHYSYVDGRDVLRGIDLTVRPGERLAMVGPSGAGKSTLGRLLAGIHPPRAGSVTIGGVPLVSLPLDRRRREVALVTQEHHVFVGTVADNVSLPRPDATEAEVRAALRAVDALGWADALPDGLGTLVGSGGTELSAAQAQQLALARLVLADPHTLVLDEATSLIDPRAARHLERSLGAVLAGRTVIAIAHRLHTAHDADRVAVVADGRIVELGPHADLVAAGGDYAALWDSWHGRH